VNLSTGLMHPRDKQTAKEIFAGLKRNGHHVNSDVIRRWAAKNGWRPKDAEELANLSKRYISD
jgi:hypothetical protein